MNKIIRIIKLSGIDQLSWLNPLFLALFPAIIIIWLQPIQFSPFIIELNQVSPDYMIFYEDLEGDGKAERFLYRNDATEGHALIRYYNDKDQYIGQHNFKYQRDKTRAILKPYAADFTSDGSKDLVFMSMHNDSLFLDAFDYQKEEGIVSKRFITTVGGFNGQHLDHNIFWLGNYDANNDNIPELYFSVSAGYAWYPRRVFRYDFANDSLITSLNTGAGDITGKIFEYKNSMLIVCGSMAHGNIRENYPSPYHDTTTWLFAFDKNLKLAIPPKNYGIAPGGIEYPVFKDNFIYYLFGSNNSQPENKLLKMNWQGNITDSIIFDFHISKSFYRFNYKKEDYYLVKDYENQQYYNFDVESFLIQNDTPFKYWTTSRIIEQNDLNLDGKTETVIFDELTNQLVVFDNRFRIQNKIFTEGDVRFLTTNFFEEKGYGEIIVNLDNQAKTFRYYENPNRLFQYPLYFGIYIVSFIFVALIQYFQNRRIQKQKVLEEQLADLQLQNLRNQLDPHFTFNVLNSVGNAIYKQDKEGAYDLFQRFTRIIRSSLMSSDKVFRTLKEELQFTQDYLEFQKLRFKNRFNYSFEVEKRVDTQLVQFPKMLIQGFAENAVKHVFYEIEYTGQITINVFRENQKLKVIIEDNGIGINRSKELKATSGTQKGLEVLQEQVKQINRIYGTSFSVQIEDKMILTPKTEGTKVKIEFPFKTSK